MWTERDFAMTGGGEDPMLINMNEHNDISVNFSTNTQQIRNQYAVIQRISNF